MISFPPQKLGEIKTAINQSLEQGASPIAAFDADGTLWNTDLGENFFDYQVENKLLSNLPERPWGHYMKLKEKDPCAAYLWLAQINSGTPLATVENWATAAVEAHSPLPLFSAMQDLIAHLQSKNVACYIVTASVAWAVEPAAQLYNIPKENVVGIRTEVVDGVVTEKQHGPITYQAGKVDGLHHRTDNQPAFFAAGNTQGDLPLLESASHVQLVLGASPEGEDIFDTERYMQKVAANRGWFHHSYV